MALTKRFPKRTLIYGLVCLGFIFTSGSLNSLGFALVCMANQTSEVPKHDAYSEKCENRFNLSSNDDGYTEEFNWSTSVQNTLLSASSWGSVVGILFSWMFDKYGAKWIYLACCVVGALSNLLTPLAARMNSVAGLVVLRALQGAGQGLAWPLLASVGANWAPSQEIGALFGFVAGGNQIGVLMNVLVASELCKTVGWSYIFYLWGFLLAIWCAMWYFFYTDTPSDTKIGITEDEYNYILSHRTIQNLSNSTEPKSIPWKSIFTSIPIYALFYTGFAGTSVFFFVNNYMPSYLKTALFMSSSRNGQLAALPMVTGIAGKVTGGILADRISCMTETGKTKLFTALGTLVPAALFLGVSFMDCTQVAPAVSLIALATYFFGFNMSGGCMKAMMTMAPRFSSTICMFVQFASFSCGMVLPLIIDKLLPDYTHQQWSHTFYFIASLFASASVVFTLFGTAEEQNWAVSLKRKGQKQTVEKFEALYQCIT